jgi:hypothetical protein
LQDIGIPFLLGDHLDGLAIVIFDIEVGPGFAED